MRLTATNSGTAPLSALRISEPGSATPGALAGELTFDGFADGIQWPAGATEAGVVYRFADGSVSSPLTATTPDTLPAVPTGAGRPSSIWQSPLGQGPRAWVPVTA